MNDEDNSMHTMMITPELLGLLPSSSNAGGTIKYNILFSIIYMLTYLKYINYRC